MVKHCCEMMTSQVNHHCDLHPDPFDCPDNLIHYSEYHGTYDLIIHDGGSSVITINFCPWCGIALPNKNLTLQSIPDLLTALRCPRVDPVNL